MISKTIKGLNLKYLRYKNQIDHYPSCFDKHKCIFFHIPKAAGTSVCSSLFGYQVGHYNFNWYYYSNPEKASSYFKFTFVRNPWARLVSAYHFLSVGGMNKTDKEWSEKNLSQFNSFSDFVLRWVNEENVNLYMHFIPQNQFITDDNGIIRADFVGKTENIQADFEKISLELGVRVSLSLENKSSHNPYIDYYDSKTKNIVASVYAKDIELFGYKFDE